MAARSFRNRSRRAPRRRTSWIGNAPDLSIFQTLAAGTAFISLAYDTRSTVVPPTPFTIARIRGRFAVSSPAATDDLEIIGAYGIAVVNGEAFDAGVASIPTPWSESFDDRWLYHTFFFGNQHQITDTFGFSMPVQIEVDNKGMRKVNFGDVIVFVIENAHNADAFEWDDAFRTLVLLQ